MDIIEQVIENVERRLWERLEWGDSEYVSGRARQMVVDRLTELVMEANLES